MSESGNSFVPKGLQQADQRAQEQASGPRSFLSAGPTDQGTQRDPRQPRSWLTGANMEGTENGFNTPFFERFFEQQKRATDRGTLDRFFDEKDATGIVTYDHRDKKFGDVYDNGTRVGNVYEAYDRKTADLLMAELTLDDDTKAVAYKAGPERITTEVERRRKETETEVGKFLTQQDYQGEVDEQRDEWDTDTAKATTVAGGAAGGALTGAGIGAGIGALFFGAGAAPGAAIGAGIGAVAGGIGAWLNQDELIDQAARAKVQQDIAGREFGTAAGVSTGIRGWSGLAMKGLSPASNLLHGGYDEIQGAAGDGISEWHAVDDEGDLKRLGVLNVADVGASLVDAAGQFASGAGVAAFTAAMSGSIIGSVSQLGFTGGATFDDRSGTFDKIYLDDDGNRDFGAAAAGVGSIAIDAVQLGMARGLTQKATQSLGNVARASGVAYAETGTGAARGLLDRLARASRTGGTRTHAGGYSYKLDDAGRAVEGSRRASITLLAPSELLQSVSAGALARRAAARRGGAVSADDFYRAAAQMAAGERPWTAALVNAFGEGTEEAVQAVLEPMSHGSTASAQEIWTAAVTGFGMGAGMTIGARSRGASADMQQYAMAYLQRSATTGEELTRAEWDRMTAVEKAKATQLPAELVETAKAAAADVARAQRTSAVGNTAAVEKYVDAVRKLALRESKRLTSRTDGAYVITQLQDAGMVDESGNVLRGSAPNHAIGSSLVQLQANLQRRLEGLGIQIRSLPADHPTRPDLEAAAAQMQQLILFVDQAARRWDAESAPAARRAVIDDVNDVIARWFDAADTSVDDVTRLARARAVSQVFARDPHDQAGSYQLLMPWVDFDLTSEGANNVVQVSHAILQAIGGDFDGDKVREQAQMMLDDESFRSLRAGMNFLGAMGRDGTSVNIPTREYETYEVRMLSQALASSDTAYGAEAAGTLSRIRTALERRYDGVLDATALGQRLDRFVRDVRAGDTAARAHLIDGLADDFGGELTELSRARLSNEWLWVDQVVQANLQRFQRIAAAHAPQPDKPNTTRLAPTSQTQDFRRVRQQVAATDGITLSLLAAGESLFRMFQKLHYSTWNASVSGAKKGNVDELVELTRAYEEMGQGMTQTELDALQSKDAVTARVELALRKLAANAREIAAATGEQLNEQASLAILANTSVPYVYTSATGELRARQNVSLLQALLARSIEQERVTHAASMSPELSAKLARLEQLTHEHSADRAFVEVFAQTQLYELLGEASAVMGTNLTVEQFVLRYSNQAEAQKQDTARLLKLEPEYLGRERKQNLPYNLTEVSDKQVSGYRAVVDAMIGAGNKRLSVDAKGHAIGDIGERSDRYHDSLVEAFRQVQLALDEVGRFRGGILRRDPAKAQRELAAFMDENKDWARAVMNLIPDSAVNAVFEVVTANGRSDLRISPWVYEMLLERDPERAAMIYWRNLTIAKWNALGTVVKDDDEPDDRTRQFDSLDSRMHRLMYRLGRAGDGGIRLQRLMVRMQESASLREFLEFVNTDLRGDEAPYVAWVDDWAEFSPDKTGGGLTAIMPGADIREAILDFKDRSDRLVTAVHDELLVEQADARTILDVSRALQLGTAASDAERAQLAALERAVEFARRNLTALGPGAMRQQSLGALLAFFAQAHTKGISPWNVVPIGKFEALGDSFGYATPFSQHEATLVGTQDPEDIGSHMGLAARDAQGSMLPDGTTVDWPQLTAAEIVKQWGNPKHRPAIRAMLFPSAYERTQDGRLVQQFLTGKSLTELLNGGTYGDFFEESHQGRMLYVSLLESRAKAHGASHAVQRFANDLLSARASSLHAALTPVQAEAMVDQAYTDAADLLRVVGELGARGALERGNVMEALKTEIRQRARLQQAAATLGFRGEETVLTQVAFDQLLQAKRSEVLDAISAAQNDAEARALKADFDRDVERIKLIMSDQPFELVRAAYTIPFGSGSQREIEAKQAEIVEYVRTHPNLLTKAGWAKTDLRAITSWLGQRNRESALPVLDKKQWDTVSRAIIGTYLDDMVTITADGVSVPVFPEASKESQLRYWDPSYGYLVEDLLDPDGPLVRAAVDLQLAAGRNAVRNSMPELIDKFFTTIYAPGSLGPWSSDVARLSNEANSRLDAAAAGDAIAMAGLAPVREATESAATRRTFAPPPPDAVATAALTLDQLMGDQTEVVPVSRAAQASELPLMALNGRFASGARLAFVGADGQPAEVDLFTVRPTLGLTYSQDASVRDSGFRAVTVRRLRNAVERALPDGATQVRVELDFVHPDAQPAGPEYANNVYFEGTSFELDADQQRSLNATLWFAPGSVSPNEQAKALKSNKSGKPALRLSDVVSSGERLALEADWAVDFAGMLRRKALYLVTKDTGSDPLQPTFFNAVFKRMKMRHFVRGFVVVGESRVPELWSAEQVISWQQENPGQTLPLEDAELWKPSPRVLRSMLGETGAQGVTRADNGVLELDITKIPPYLGDTSAIAAAMPGVLEVGPDGGFTRASFYDTQAAARSNQSRLRVGPAISTARRTAYEEGLRTADARRQDIHAAREKRYGGNDNTLRQWATQAAQVAQGAFEATPSGINGRAAGLPFIAGRNITDTAISSALFAELNAALQLDNLRAAWVYREGTDGSAAPTSGVLNEISLGNDGRDKGTRHLQLAPDDVVVIDLESFEQTYGAGTEEGRAAAISRLRVMLAARATVVLPDGRTGGDLRYELGQFMRESGYRPVEGSKHIFRPMRANEVYATLQARQSTLTETHAISAQSALTIFLTQDKPLMENAAAVVNPGLRTPLAITADLVPVNAFGRFNVPIEPAHVQAVKQQVRVLADSAPDSPQRSLMYDLAGTAAGTAEARELDVALRRLVETWDDDPSNPRVTPRRGAQFGTGDLIPLFDAKTGAILFYRHGHKAPRPADLERQLNTTYVDGERGANLAFYRIDRNPSHTTHRGEVVHFSPRSQYGLSVQMRVPLQELGDKLQLEGNGMKYVLTPKSKSIVFPEHGVFEDWPIDLVAGWADTQSKESYLGLVDNFRAAFAHFGVDFMPELAEVFFGDSTRTEDVVTVLRTIQRRLPRQEVPVLHDLLRNQAPEARLTELLAPLGGATVSELGLVASWVQDMTNAQPTPAQQIARAVVLYLMAPQAELEHVLRSGGFNAPNARTSGGLSVMMPQLFTNFFDRAPLGSPLRRYLFDKLNGQIFNPNGDGTGYYLSEDFSFHVVNKNAADNMSGWLQFAEAHSSGDNPVLNEMAMDRQDEQKVSAHTIDVAFQAIGARSSVPSALSKTEQFVQRAGVEKFHDPTALWNLLRDTPVDDTTYAAWRQLNPAELYRKNLAREAVAEFRRPLDTSGGETYEPWSEQEIGKFETLRNEVALAYGLTEKQSGIVDFWIRQMLGQPLGEGDMGRISYTAAMETMDKELLWNAQRGFLPTHGAEVPQIHYHDLNLLYRAYEKRSAEGARTGFSLRGSAKNNEVVTTWSDWVNVALAIGETEHDQFDPMFLLATDGFMHSYMDAEERLVGLPVSRSALVSQKLLDPETMRLVLSRDPSQLAIMDEAPLLDVTAATLADIMGGQRMAGGRYRGKAVPASVRARRQAARVKWRKENGIPSPIPFSIGNYSEAGALFVDESTTSNALLRIVTNLRVGNALFNPLLWVSAIGETVIRGTLEDATNILTGDSTGALAQALPATSRYTPTQLKKFRQLSRMLGQRADFKGMLYRELMFQQPKMSNAGRVERWTHNFARLGASMQDPTYGMRGDVLARRYLEAVLLELSARVTATPVSADYVVGQLSTDPLWLQKNMPEVHRAAAATIANVRSLKATPVSLALRGVYEPLSKNPNLLVAMPSTLFLKLPLMFSTYATNVATTILGLQGASALTAMFLDGRKKGLIGRMQAAIGGTEFNEDTDSTFDMGEVLEGIDLSKAFIQSGLTHTSLFALGMAAGGLGLSGEDEEDRRRRRAAQMQGAGYVYDPRKIENDFRNSDAVFLDALPFGLGSLFSGAPQDERQMINLHWMMKQFISPLMGMERFFETGDPRQIVWGFQEAISSFPLINSASWDDAVTTFAELTKTAAEHEAEGTEDSLVTSYDFLLKGMWTMERMLFENSFINMLYVGADRYDRDPWVLPERDAEGNIMRDRMDVPRPTKGMQDYVDPATGEVHSGYVQRDWWDAQLHGFAENRATLALMGSLFTGFADSTLLRDNMAAKIRKIDKPELTDEETQGLVLAIFDEETGGEVLTADGSRAVFRGLWKGSVALDSPALEGLFIPFETRAQLQTEWMDELVQEGVDLGLNEYQAKARMREIWYGPTNNPMVQGLGDILWSDKISYTKTLRYNQLNTTYVIGPDGYPWATGIQRDKLMNAFGLMGSRYYRGDVGNLGVDGRLNSIDEVVGLNTGLRGLERADDTWLVPTPEEIAEKIEDAMKEAMAKQYQPSEWEDFGKSGWKNWGSGGYRRRGGGGGGGGYFSKLSAPQDNQTPYGNTISFINTSNPIIRRATVRRERYDSDRGRLNQWQ